MRSTNTARPIVLTLFMLLAVAVKGHQAHAQSVETLTVAGGCFWCVESDFESVPGVLSAVSGYTGGNTKSPTYKQVTAGGTGHYEAVQIRFDPTMVTRRQLLSMFLRSVDPTDADGQFCDRGDSYRTAIFTSGSDQTSVAKAVKSEAQSALGQTIVTPILPATAFYPAEAYHQDYYKGRKLVLTRFGPKRQSEAYKRYRKACGRDARVLQLWGDAAPFAKGH
ncbi:peptide-methionine (S)-S-oxide reductase MsrA [Phaeobacter inhibens]|uniref:peptide-methionine (S)-S-oxide reductase MsrA n=1 Tax=Phaeobacter inhibens TaxID=221822 RepID=UPI0021A64882|nr:peptide-methionine (S)-S-oxide reductase MsrA [Phaeobacter inhibens]UWR58633.1 peptide-methionine (S)-S-oxide reductase MsrA [Phaeobacter inhibens]UWR66492.1 peptide-methionine (S)-S-oxide reductase MsrA [Phaeobacter inhibens]UWR98026.1 peptide-methionine (S)-S-oxide reductase MsrA [Phaeobacter inhibens]UWS02051.1 peptide-methionine (S)-S-oxide reductase MsrA [Phaeobacter inhibens]UWS04007.1 peptide-methionine (S)-S-oxide reductase MsrA [Phaeobacter inhibens]